MNKKFFINKINFKKPNAFSMIELTIVILIIGLIFAGVIGSKKLVSIANLSKARALTNSSPVAGIEGLSLWLDSISKDSFLSGEAIDGGAISRWKDINPQSTNKKDVTASGGTSPIYTEGAINGLSALSFNGANKFLSRSTYSYELAKTNEVTVFVAAKSISPAQDSSILSWVAGGNNRLNIHYTWSDSVIYFDFGTGAASGVTRLNVAAPSGFMDNWTIASFIKRSDGTGDISVNNTILSSGTTLSGTLDTVSSPSFYVGSWIGTSQYKGLIAELIIFERAISDAERLEVTKYLSKKWGIKIN